MYIIKKFGEYFFTKIEEDILQEALALLEEKEKLIFLGMGKYDQKHSLEVYKKVRENDLLKNEVLYLKLALLHDSGKGRANIIKRILHKLGLKTQLKFHPENGYEKLKNIDESLGILVKNHHKKNYDKYMDEFQRIDDLS